jgi:uncharacterized membrane protein
MDADAVGDDHGTPRDPRLRTVLLAQLPPLVMVLVANVVAIFICVRLIGVWPTLAIWCVLLGLVGSVVIRLLRLRRQR